MAISLQTITRALKSMGFIAATKKKKPYLTEEHKRKRLQFAKAHKDWTVSDCQIGER